MGKERILDKTKKARISRFIHVSEIIPIVLSDIEKERQKHLKKTREQISRGFKLPKKFLTIHPLNRRRRGGII